MLEVFVKTNKAVIELFQMSKEGENGGKTTD